ncbi:MAG TPA: GNAT family N-acetyltransferase [Kofleriaceae bacterium]
MLSAPPRATIPKLADLPLVIEGPRVTLRPQRDSDAEAFFPYVSDPELPKFVSWAPHKDIAETRAWVQDAAELIDKGTDMVWTIEHEGAPVGCVGLHGIKWGVRAVRLDRADLGYWIAKPFWGKGLMTEAAIAATRWAFETLGLHKVVVICFEDNLASKRVIEKVGFRFVGRAEEDIWRDGRWFAHLKFELTSSEWADSTRTLRFNRPRS